MEACGILIDLSEPVENSPLKPAHSKSPPSSKSPCFCDVSRKSPDAAASQRKSEDSQDSLADSIEIERSSDRRGSYTIDRSQLLQDLSEITAESDSGSDQTGHLPPGGIQLLEDEEFDFDLPLSPAVRVLSSPKAVDDDDEEVFIGPIGFTEKCVASVVSEIAPLQEPLKPLSPLKPHQIAEIFKEAQLVVYRINNEETDEEGKGAKQGSKGRNGGAQTPPKHHQRKGTFTESPEAFIRLPESVVKAMPVIDIEINDPFQTKVEENKENSQKEVPSRLAPPKSRTLPGTTRSGKGQTGSSQCLNDAATSDTDDSCSVTSDTSETSLSRLPFNKSGVAKPKVLTGKAGLKRPSMLKPPGNKSNENLSISSASKTTSTTSSSSKIVPPAKSRRSLNTSSRKSLGLNTSGIPNSTKPTGNITSKETDNMNRKGPTTRLSLVKPGSIQKPVVKAQQQPLTDSRSRTGPLKALPIISNIPDKTETVKPTLTKQMLLNPEVCTPVKADKKVQPKLLSTNFTTPVRSNSVSSCTPASVRRKSCLPTPQKTRSGSTSAIPQPSPVVRPSGSSTQRPSSTSSQRQSVSESPYVNRSLRNSISTGKREIPKSRHSIAGKTSPIKSIPKRAAVQSVYQGRRSLALYKTTAK